MKVSERSMWACGIVLADLFILVLPLAALLLAYVLVSRPAWFKQWVDKVYA
jgi:hypothetical protein